ncbi:A24 family peptidase [Maritalea sp.]|uniref:A24 family peptidase n=1 Tax=Maritalea sp. TaxID=2003361 RepID=UPI003EF3453F
MFYSALAIIFPFIMAVAAAYDLLTMRIPNWVSLALVAVFVICGFVVGLPLQEIGIHFLVGIAVLIVAFLLFIPGWIGGGDAKFAAAIGLWMGTANIFEFLLYSAFFGGILTLVLLLFRWKVPVSVLPKAEWILRLHDKSVGAPYGIALAAGAMIVYAESAIYIGLMLP